jgi:hypothetical protein
VTNDGLVDQWPLTDGTNVVYNAQPDPNVQAFNISLLEGDGGLFVLSPAATIPSPNRASIIKLARGASRTHRPSAVACSFSCETRQERRPA